MRIPFSFVKPSFNPSTDTLSLWLRSPDAELTGDLTTLAWGSRASAGASGSASVGHYGTDAVTQPGTSFNGFSTVHFPSTDAQLSSAQNAHTTLLGCGDDVGANYTVAYVVQPLSSGAHVVDGGGLYTYANAMLLGDFGGYMGHVLSSDGGTAKIGALHWDSALGIAGSYGTTPFTWPGGFGKWGLVWFIYTLSGTSMKMRVKTAGAAVSESTQTLNALKFAAASASVAILNGGTGAGLTMRIAEVMIWPGQALTGAQITAREQGYFRSRYPTLGL